MKVGFATAAAYLHAELVVRVRLQLPLEGLALFPVVHVRHCCGFWVLEWRKRKDGGGPNNGKTLRRKERGGLVAVRPGLPSSWSSRRPYGR
jgi:hypothetical protein